MPSSHDKIKTLTFPRASKVRVRVWIKLSCGATTMVVTKVLQRVFRIWLQARNSHKLIRNT